MSKIGKIPIEIPDKVEVKLSNDKIKVKGPLGENELLIHSDIIIKKEDNKIRVMLKQGGNKALWGTFARLINNLIIGVLNGFEKKLEIKGVGYKAQVQGKKLILNVGYSHPVELEIESDLNVKVDGNIIIISGIDKQKVGEFAARVRKVRPPEPYHGKGIKYIDEVIIRKAGKQVKTT